MLVFGATALLTAVRPQRFQLPLAYLDTTSREMVVQHENRDCLQGGPAYLQPGKNMGAFGERPIESDDAKRY